MFVDEEDRRAFLFLFTEVTNRFHVTCHSLCEMTTHYHAVITTRDANLSDAMHKLNGEYACWFNARHGRVGHLFERRFTAQIIQHGSYFLTACRYVARNPVRAGMAARPEDWAWNSYAATVGLCPRPEYLSVDTLLAEFDDDAETAMQCYARFVMSRRPDALPSDPILGDRAFVSRFSATARRASTEVPRRERYVERHPLPQLFDGVLTRADRDAAIVRAYRAGFRLSEVARLLGLHYSTVSKVLNRCHRLKKPSIQDLAPIAVGARP